MPVSQQVTTRFKVPPVKSFDHEALVRFCGCRVPRCRFNRPGDHANDVHVHHVRRSSNSGTGMKPGSDQTIGLCMRHHADLHQRGEKTCAQEWGIDLMQEAERLAAAGRMLGFLPQ